MLGGCACVCACVCVCLCVCVCVYNEGLGVRVMHREFGFYLNNTGIRISSNQGSLLVNGLRAVLRSGTCLELSHVFAVFVIFISWCFVNL